jgi:predicted DNA-binding transcriptional regulator AlpA
MNRNLGSNPPSTGIMSLLILNEILELFRFKKTKLFYLLKKNLFPCPIHFFKQLRWDPRDIAEYIDNDCKMTPELLQKSCSRKIKAS